MVPEAEAECASLGARCLFATGSVSEMLKKGVGDADAAFSLAPRGFGRNSFRVWEMLQAGLLPIYLYSDVPWSAGTRADLSVLGAS
eukprot:gene1953-4824_t